MKQNSRWKSFTVSLLMLALVATTTPVFADEVMLPGPGVTAPDSTLQADGVKDFSDFDGQEDVVWLHIVNGNFKLREGQEGLGPEYGDADVSAAPSVPVKLDDDRRLPSELLDKIEVTRTNGEFAGWYTKAPTEELQSAGKDGGLYSVWHTVKINGTKIEKGEQVPEDVSVLYAAFNDKSTGAEDSDRLVTFYLDWNGIDGMFGHCLTCIRSYDDGRTKFTADDAAVYSLNFDGDDEKEFKAANSGEDKWKLLEKIWTKSGKNYNGYTFKGWSTDAEGTNMVWSDTELRDGMSFYAQWEKDGQSSSTFDRTDPAAGPLENIRIVGDGLSTSLSASRHAKAGESFTLSIFRSPVRAKAEDVTWSLLISTADKENKFKTNTTEVTVTAGKSEPQDPYEGLKIKAEGDSLTLTATDDTVRSIEVGVTAKSIEGKEVSAPANAVVSFVHTWDKGSQTGEPTCTTGATVTYSCTQDGCNAVKEEKISPLGHVYGKLEGERYYTVTKEPTCTEDGEKQYKCIRCGDEAGPKAVIPALGHDWKVKSEVAVSCNENLVTKECLRDDCSTVVNELVPADNPQLHKWTITDRVHMSCMSDRVYARCADCGQTKQYTEAANNPECHSYAYESRMPIDCQWTAYRFTCVHGCGSFEVKLVKEENHVWGSWKTTKAATTTAAGELARTCSRCGEKETRVIPQIKVKAAYALSSVKVQESHVWGSWKTTKAATATTVGTQTRVCSTCGEKETKAVPKLKVKISYALNGGKNNAKNPTTVEKTVVLKAPTRAGYTFQGWYKDKKLKSKVTKIASSQKTNVTVYAKWQKVSVSKVKMTSIKKSGSRKAKVNFKNVSGAKGYEIVYSTNKNFKNSKKVTVKSASATLKNLKKNGKYYVKVRAYKTDSAGKKVYGSYSGVKSVKVK